MTARPRLPHWMPQEIDATTWVKGYGCLMDPAGLRTAAPEYVQPQPEPPEPPEERFAGSLQWGMLLSSYLDYVEIEPVRDATVDSRQQSLYLLEVVDVCVKVGISGDIAARMRGHAAMAAKFGRSLGRLWVSPPHPEARRNESAMKLGSAYGEYLRMSLEEAVAKASSLKMTVTARLVKWEP